MISVKNLPGTAACSVEAPAALFNLKGTCAVITGAASGIGQMMAVGLAAAGARCALLDIADTGQTRKLIEENGGSAESFFCDLAAAAETAEPLFSTIHSRFGSIDILVNCGGITFRSPAMDYPLEAFQNVLNINLTAVFLLSQIAARYMKEQGGGHIINMASALSFQGGMFVPGYTASKGGVAQLTKALANEWARYNINVNAIAPGYIDTALNTAVIQDPERNRQVLDRLPCARWGKPEDFIGTVIFLSSPASAYITGHVLCVDGGYQSR